MNYVAASKTVVRLSVFQRFNATYVGRKAEISRSFYSLNVKVFPIGLTLGRLAEMSFALPARFGKWMEVIEMIASSSTRAINLGLPSYSELASVPIEKLRDLGHFAELLSDAPDNAGSGPQRLDVSAKTLREHYCTCRMHESGEVSPLPASVAVSPTGIILARPITLEEPDIVPSVIPPPSFSQEAARKGGLYFNGSDVFHISSKKGAIRVEYTGPFGDFGTPSIELASRNVRPLVLAGAGNLTIRVFDRVPSISELETRHIKTHHSFTADHNGVVVAKMCVEQHDDYLSVANRKVPQFYFGVILVDPDYEGGMFVRLCISFVSRIFKGKTIRQQLFDSFPITFMTQNRIIQELTRELIGAKTEGDLSPEQQHRIDFFAKKKGWKLSEGNFVEDAYPAMLVRDPKLLIKGCENGGKNNGGKVMTGEINIFTLVKLVGKYILNKFLRIVGIR